MKLGIVGYGNIARKHIAAISEIDDLQLIAIADPKPGIEFPDGVNGYSDIEAMLTTHKDLDIVSVCTPNGYHEEHSLKALKAGYHVICEKPLSLNIESCRTIQEAVQKYDKRLVCVMQNRYSPVSQWLKKLVTGDQLGKIYMVNVSCYWNRNAVYYKSSDWRGDIAIDGGTLFTQFSHYVDTLYWLFGKIEVRNAVFNNCNHGESIAFEDSGIFTFITEDGALGSFNYTTANFMENFESTFTVVGEKGTLKIAGQYMDRLVHCNIDNVDPPKLELGDNIRHLKEVYLSAMNSFNGKAHKSTSIMDGTEVVGIIESVYSFKK